MFLHIILFTYICIYIDLLLVSTPWQGSKSMGGAKAKEVEKAAGGSSRLETKAAEAAMGGSPEVRGDRAEAFAVGSISERDGPRI